MADKRAQRAQKKREKSRLKREAARKQRGSRGGGTPAARGPSLASAAGWPVGECWVSDNWDQRGAQVLVAFSRVNSAGSAAVAFFELDLADEGVTEVTTFTGVTPDQVMGESGKRGGERTMFASDPALAVKLVREARAFGADAPSAYDEAVRLFGDVRAEDCDEEILLGLEDTEEVEAPAPGLLGGVKRFFGL